QPFLNLGMLLVQKGDNDGALVQLKRAAALSPDNPTVHEQLGSAYESLNNWSEAKAELERAIALAPKVSGLHFKLARIDKKLGLQDEARHEFQICAELNSTRSSRQTPNPARPH
ncbi:MAG TPA: tetratricopeptide repeat protein, partial [Acidobacteriaceae bacterium]|nr:tetratricopeptide repeat protein [Acidobacteriaceae bacterium]